MLKIEFDKLRQAQRIQKKLLAQQIISPSQHLDASEFAQKIMQILKKEIPQLKNHPVAENQSTSDSNSPPISPISNKISPITSPSPSPSSNPGSQTFVINLQEQDEDASSPRRRVSRKRRTHSAPSVSQIVLKSFPAQTHCVGREFLRDRRPIRYLQVTENLETMMGEVLGQECKIKMQVKIREAHICRYHLLDP
jgi:hypothetical protein